MTPIRKHLLFVDDERAIRETLSVILLRYGFTVSVAASVSEALQKIETTEFDLLLCDLNITGENDGLEVVRAMKKVCPDCVTIILTAYPGVDSALESIHLGVDEYITKPAHADELVALLAQKLASRANRLAAKRKEKDTSITGDPFLTHRNSDTIH